MAGHSSRADYVNLPASRPSTSLLERKAWMPGTRPDMTTFHGSRRSQFLQIDQPRHAFARQRHQRQEFILRERRLFGRTLHLDDAAIAGHHKISVGIGL